MKAVVDRDACIGCELCAGTCPEVFHMDDDGISVAIEEDIPEDAVDTAKDSEAQCPTNAIAIND